MLRKESSERGKQVENAEGRGVGEGRTAVLGLGLGCASWRREQGHKGLRAEEHSRRNSESPGAESAVCLACLRSSKGAGGARALCGLLPGVWREGSSLRVRICPTPPCPAVPRGQSQSRRWFCDLSCFVCGRGGGWASRFWPCVCERDACFLSFFF